jgi:endogenous inhibitor of DNA gyrase (YacG/DUF329 family)
MRNCPNCSKASDPAHAPFCSRRCREIDLHRWLTGSYTIAAVEEDDADMEDSDS